MGKTKRDQARDIILKALINETNSNLADAIVDAIELMTSKVKKPEKTEGSRIWEAYVEAYKKRYQVEPVRNATVNNQAAQIARRVGGDGGVEIVKFFLNQNDAFYSRTMHQIGICLKDCEMLSARMRTGTTVTRRAAEKLESATATLGASNSYLNKKYGAQVQVPEGEKK